MNPHVDFILWVESIKEKYNLHFHFSFHKRNNLVWYSKDGPMILLNRKEIDSPYIKGVFFHELGHVLNPPEDWVKKEYKVFKIIELSQLLLLPLYTYLGREFYENFGINYWISVYSFLYLFKITLNYKAKKLTDELQRLEFEADRVSQLMDHENSFVVKLREKRFWLNLKDMFVRVVPVFIIITHPFSYEREQRLSK